jgi:hypothetical protein
MSMRKAEQPKRHKAFRMELQEAGYAYVRP